MILRALGVGRIAVVNVENACATAATAFQQACTMVSAGPYDVVLACGVEKLYHPDKLKTFSVFSGAVDVEAMDTVIAGIGRRLESARCADRHRRRRHHALVVHGYLCDLGTGRT